MDIYKIEKKEGRIAVEELERLRCVRKKGKITVKCKEKNDWIEYVRCQCILGNSMKRIFNEADDYYLIVGDNTAAVSIVYDDAGNVVYYLRGEADWKLIEVEILAPEYCFQMDSLCEKTAGRVEIVTFLMLVSFSHKYGFSRVFKSETPEYLRKLFKEVIRNEALDERDFELEHKIENLISRNGMREEFVENYMHHYR